MLNLNFKNNIIIKHKCYNIVFLNLSNLTKYFYYLIECVQAVL